MQKNFSIFIVSINVIFFLVWSISHAPSKKNNTIKRAKTRKWSTILFVATVFLTCLYIGQPVYGLRVALPLVLLHMSLSKIIETN